MRIDEFDLEIYSLDGTSKVFYSMKENNDNLDVQITGCKIISYLSLNGMSIGILMSYTSLKLAVKRQ